VIPVNFFVIPGHREAMSPESITTGGSFEEGWAAIVLKSKRCGYGFRARDFVAPRNDDKQNA